MIRLLLDYGSKINDTDGDGNTVLHLVCGAYVESDGVKELADMVRLLLDRGARNDLGNRSGETPFQVAFQHGHFQICEILMRRRRKVQPMKFKDLEHMLGTIILSCPKKYEAFNLLHDLDIGGCLWTTSTLLMRLVQLGQFPLAEAYLDRKTPPLSAEEKSAILHTTIGRGHAHLAKRMFALKAPVNTLDKNGHTPLYKAVSSVALSDLDDVVKALLLAGADIHFRYEPINSYLTPLQKAILTRKHSSAELMLRHRPLHDDPVAPKGIYLHTAAGVFSSKRMFSSLIRAGANVTELDSNGNTPLSVFLMMADRPQWIAHAGVEKTICSTIWHLWSKDIDISRKNSSDKSILSYLTALRLYDGEDVARKRVAKALQRRIQIVPAAGKQGENTLRFSLCFVDGDAVDDDEGEV